MMTTTCRIYDFASGSKAELVEVGGKALSLIKMTQAGLPVPPGFVLPVSFFRAWFEQLEKTKAWQTFLDADTEKGLQAACKKLKAEAEKFKFSQEQAESVKDSLKKLQTTSTIFAVRSSSPEEDLEGSSFAGGYETILGVTESGLEEAVNRAFASCLDHRVVVYKKAHNFNWKSPKIAVIVQAQIASDVAGVGFSVNPLSNYYDEAVFNANWGLGETVVAGLATPDTFVVNKNTEAIISKDLGAKQTSIFLLENGGTEQRPSNRSSEFTLSDEQLVELCKLTCDVEKSYGRPMDIEWAFSKDENNKTTLYLLQARPVTTNIPLADELITSPSEFRRLYLDATISVQGLYKPLSPMGTSFLKLLLKKLTKFVFGRDFTLNVDDTPAIVSSGRLYLNLNNCFALAGKERVVNVVKNMDPLTAKALEAVDPETYRSNSKELKKHPFHLLWHLPVLGVRILDSRILPEHSHNKCQDEVKAYLKASRRLAKRKMPFAQFVDELMTETVKIIFKHTMPRFVTSRVALERMKQIAGEEIFSTQDFNSLEKSLPYNPTVEMGLALYQLSKLVPDGLDADTLVERLAKEDFLPKEFLKSWKSYMKLYGHRCPVELDIASTRYRDNPRTLVDQLISLKNSATDEDNPQARFDRNRNERQKAFERIVEQIAKAKGWVQKERFKSLYHVYSTLGGYRETHKYLLIFALDLIRQRVLELAEDLVPSEKSKEAPKSEKAKKSASSGKSGASEILEAIGKFAASGKSESNGKSAEPDRLDSISQVFDLTLDEFAKSLVSKKMDLRKLSKENRKFIDRLVACKQLPQLIDSRGLIIRPPRVPAKEGEVQGTPISAGLIRGPIKVLHSPDEKPLLKGEILVAQATDPGWTPLFVNAAAVILEIGGMLQHGALVAREYGLPCVAGIENATELWTDGTMVEVDGANGIVRRI